MKQSAAPRRWRTVLAAGAVLALCAGLVIGLWLKPAATTQPVTVSPPVAATVESQPAPVAAVADAVSAPSPASPALAPNTSQPVIPADPSDPSNLSQLRGRNLTLPVTGISAAQLNDTYTQARAAGAPHEALDIMAPNGTPVLAIEDGRIAKLFLSKPGGITLYQFDPDGMYAYYYAHLDRYADDIAEGVSVRKGQVIGYVGSTGNALPEAPHLHFAIFRLGPERQWWRGTPINPFLIWRDAKP